MKRNIFVFHGRLGNPKENWFPWLKEKLEKKGCTVFIPQFPTPMEESLESWLKILARYKKYINKDTILIGHSRGARFLFHVLESLPVPVYAAFFVGVSIGIKQVAYSREAYKFANGYKFNWDLIKNSAGYFFLYHSDNDPYVHLDNARKVAKILGIKLTLIPRAGHFNTASGYVRFEKLYKDLLSIMD